MHESRPGSIDDQREDRTVAAARGAAVANAVTRVEAAGRKAGKHHLPVVPEVKRVVSKPVGEKRKFVCAKRPKRGKGSGAKGGFRPWC